MIKLQGKTGKLTIKVEYFDTSLSINDRTDKKSSRIEKT